MDDGELRGLVETYSAEQRADEVVWFYRHAESINPKVIVEIGLKEGGNLKILSTLAPIDGLVIGIDPGGVDVLPWINEALCPVEHVRGASLAPATVAEVEGILGDRQIDVLFIDGDHSHPGMLGDYHVYGRMVRPGGIIAVHDIYYLRPVAAAWNDILGDKFESPQNQSSIGIGFIKK